MSLLGELRRRNVFRVAAGYVVVGWLIIQVVAALSAPLNLPEWFGTVVVVLLGLGLPIALVFAWAFELTPDGVRLTGPSSGPSPAKGNKLDYALIAGLLLIAAASFLGNRELAGSLGQKAGTSAQSIAVLPFADMSPNGDQEYFADGIAEELLNELTRLEGLEVAGRTSSFAFKNTAEDLQSIGAALGVATILEGSVRKDGDRIRVTAQLIDADNGYHLWSETYDRELRDIFAIQEDIATSVAGALGVRLGVGDVNSFRGAGTTSVAAYEAYLEGLALAPSEEAIPFYEQATRLDPSYAVAWAQLGLRTAATQFKFAPEEAPAIRERALEYIQRAADLDPDSAETLALLGTQLYSNHRWIEGEQAQLRALSLLKDRVPLVQYGNLLARSGRSADAIRQFELARELDSPNFRPSVNTWAAYLAAGRLDEAREAIAYFDRVETPIQRLSIALSARDRDEIRSLLSAMPAGALPTSALYAPILGELDLPERAIEILRTLHEDASVVWPSKGHDISMLAAYFGDPELALEAFRPELRYETIRLLALWYPHMAEVRALPGFKELVTEINLVEFWRASGWADACQPIGDDDFSCG